MKYIFALFFLFFLYSLSAHAKLVHYDLKVAHLSANLSGKKTVDFPMAVNGTIPAPTLEFTEGDDVEITVTNQLGNDELSIHWHGILLPVEMDGVPYVTTPSIHPGETFTFRFKLRQHGTYWYHSHTNIQEQKGVFGAFIIHPKKETLKVDKDLVAVLSDWSDEDPIQIIKNLRKDGDYYLRKKNSVRSWWGALSEGKLGTFLGNEWIRMGGMDLSDVGYDAFLVNGKREFRFSGLKEGEKVRLRLINAAASSYFYVNSAIGPVKVVSADGIDIAPIETPEILMGMAETYDLLLNVLPNKSYELKVTAQDGTGTASLWIGNGTRLSAKERPKPGLYESMDHSGHGGHSAHGGHGGHSAHAEHSHNHAPQSTPVETLTVDSLKSKEATNFESKKVAQEIRFILDGDMSRYVWHLNGKTINQDRTVNIKEGDVIRFVFENQSMMHHPMHLHGHFFRVLTDQGDFSPLKHTVDVGPHQTRTIEFLANEPGDWMLHCHNLYHLKNGMARVIKYSSYTPSEKLQRLQHHDPHLHDHAYFYGSIDAGTPGAQLMGRAMQTWNEIEVRAEATNPSSGIFAFDKGWEIEGDLFFSRYFGQFFSLALGATYFNSVPSAIGGVRYKLPLLIQSAVYINHSGKFRIDLTKHFQWFTDIFSEVELRWRPDQGADHPLDVRVNLLYSPDWHWAAGLYATNSNIGVGGKLQF